MGNVGKMKMSDETVKVQNDSRLMKTTFETSLSLFLP